MKILAMALVSASMLFGAVDINNAGQKELMSLKGLGEKRAAAVMEYRKKHCFKSVDEITHVKGLGKKFLEKNKKSMKAGSCKRKK